MTDGGNTRSRASQTSTTTPNNDNELIVCLFYCLLLSMKFIFIYFLLVYPLRVHCSSAVPVESPTSACMKSGSALTQLHIQTDR